MELFKASRLGKGLYVCEGKDHGLVHARQLVYHCVISPG